ncbi:11462_t:CDS:2, partial [Gigaspora rosea]
MQKLTREEKQSTGEKVYKARGQRYWRKKAIIANSKTGREKSISIVIRGTREKVKKKWKAKHSMWHIMQNKAEEEDMQRSIEAHGEMIVSDQ